MTALAISVLDIAPEPYAAAPSLLARLRIEEPDGDAVHAVALKCQVRIEPQGRAYSEGEQVSLGDLFGARERWGSTLRPFLWMQTSTLVPGFTAECECDLPMPVTYDTEVAGAKYLHALQDGVAGLVFLFSGTVFRRGATGFAVSQIPWDTEASYRMPVAVWRAVMDLHFPGEGWLRLPTDTISTLVAYRTARGLTSWDATMASLLAAASNGAAS